MRISCTRCKTSAFWHWRQFFILILVPLLAACTILPAAPSTPTQAAGPARITSTRSPDEARATTLARQFPSLESAMSITATPPEMLAAQQTALAATQAAPSPTPTRTRLPLQSSDLLYLSANGTLMRWDHFTGYSSLLVEDVEAFSASANGKKIALVRPLEISANGQALYNIDLLDYDTKQTFVILEEVPRPKSLAISPDGKWIAYFEDSTGGIVHARRTDTPGHHVEMGECQAANELHCTQLAWSPDNRQALWSDSRGLWSSAPLQPEAQQIHIGRVSVSDPRGNLTDIPVTFSAISWSPTGRFVLVRVSPSPQGVHWQAVVDTRLGKSSSVPDSSEYTAQTVNVSWMESGSLLVAHGSGAGGQPFVKIWDVVPTNLTLMVLNKAFDLQSNDFPPLPQMIAATAESAVPGSENQSDISNCLNWPDQIDEISLRLGLQINGSSGTPMLFTLSLIDGRVQKLINLPQDVMEVIWSPDDSGALVLGSHAQILFYRSKDNTLLDLYSVIGKGATAFTWLAPAPRH